MDHGELKRCIARLSRHDFAEFITRLFNTDTRSTGYEQLRSAPELAEDTFRQPYLDSYGGSIERVFLVHSPPLEAFTPSLGFELDDPTLEGRLQHVARHFAGRRGRWGMVDPHLREDDALKTVGILTSLYGLQYPIYDEFLIPAYRRLVDRCGLASAFTIVGSPDSFVELNYSDAVTVYKEMFSSGPTGLAVSVTADGARVRPFSDERILGAGVTSRDADPYEPVFIGEAIRQQATLSEFERLLLTDPKESELEEFISVHYRDIFGSKYDRIETQLWLRFPDLDISGKDRRLDVFLRNSVTNDWELFEMKRLIRVSRTYRDVPVLVSELANAIQQTKNYARTLAQDSVKKHFASIGIEYFEPQLHVVVGRTPNIAKEQWAWLRASNQDSMRIITYDDLLSELRCRFSERHELLGRLKQGS